jgi:hypothetical protein
MQVYFSHSYRDVAINSYFLEHLAGEDLPLLADQKSDVWCVAKLERYLSEINGFVSIIPRRPTPEDPNAYSPYIARELDLARRARVNRLLFVDEHVLKQHRLQFPKNVVPFTSDSPAEMEALHYEEIRKFRTKLETTIPYPRSPGKQATLVIGEGRIIKSAAPDVAEILKREDYAVTVLQGRFQDRGLDDIRLLETLWESELCVFMLGERLSDAHLALAVAHADCIPSIRLQYTRLTADVKPNPTLAGVFHWNEPESMLLEFQAQVSSYKGGLIRPVEMAQESSAKDAAEKIATMKWRVRSDNLWRMDDYPALIEHVYPGHGFVQDEVNRVRQTINQPLGRDRDRPASMNICRLLYDGLCRHRFGYEVEPQTGEVDEQKIRTPTQIETHRTATCLDLACLFAALLEGAQQRAMIAILKGPTFRHALAGYLALSEPDWSETTIGDLRRALELGEAVFFEATGAVEAQQPVGAETEQDRRDKLLDFSTAKTAATKMIKGEDIRLEYLLDVYASRHPGD